MSLLSSLSLRDGNVACYRLAFYLHSRIEAFCLTHLLLGFVIFSPKKYLFLQELTWLDFYQGSLPFRKTPCTLTHCRSLVIFPQTTRRLFAHCPLTIGVSWEIEVRFRLSDPSLAQFKRTYNLQGEGARKCLSPCPDTSYINQSRMTRVHTEPDLTRNKAYKHPLRNQLPSFGAPSSPGPAWPLTTSWRLGLLYPAGEGFSSEWLGNFFLEPQGEVSLGAGEVTRVTELC